MWHSRPRLCSAMTAKGISRTKAARGCAGLSARRTTARRAPTQRRRPATNGGSDAIPNTGRSPWWRACAGGEAPVCAAGVAAKIRAASPGGRRTPPRRLATRRAGRLPGARNRNRQNRKAQEFLGCAGATVVKRDHRFAGDLLGDATVAPLGTLPAGELGPSPAYIDNMRLSPSRDTLE